MYTQVWDQTTNKVSETTIQRDEDGAFIPLDEGNRDYQEYKAWLDEGNEPTAATPPSTGEDNGTTTTTGHSASTAGGPERGEEHSRPTEPDARSQPSGKQPTRSTEPTREPTLPRGGATTQHGPASRGQPKRTGR
jgi:hypothetical protein